MVPVDPGRGAPTQGPAVLSSVRGENAESEYIAYVSEQNLLPDTSGEPVRHPQVAEVFVQDDKGSYRPRNSLLN